MNFLPQIPGIEVYGTHGVYQIKGNVKVSIIFLMGSYELCIKKNDQPYYNSEIGYDDVRRLFRRIGSGR